MTLGRSRAVYRGQPVLPVLDRFAPGACGYLCGPACHRADLLTLNARSDNRLHAFGARRAASRWVRARVGWLVAGAGPRPDTLARAPIDALALPMHCLVELSSAAGRPVRGRSPWRLTCLFIDARAASPGLRSGEGLVIGS